MKGGTTPVPVFFSRRTPPLFECLQYFLADLPNSRSRVARLWHCRPCEPSPLVLFTSSQLTQNSPLSTRHQEISPLPPPTFPLRSPPFFKTHKKITIQALFTSEKVPPFSTSPSPSQPWKKGKRSDLLPHASNFLTPTFFLTFNIFRSPALM